MTKTKTAIIATAAAIGGMVIGQTAPVQAQLGGLFRGGAVVLLVDKFGGQIDRTVNQVTGNKTNNTTESTRVVPILSVGQGTAVGAVQVSGPKELIDKVKAVAQAEGKVKLGTDVRFKGLIPVSTNGVSDISKLSRVKGVGVSAIIDLKL